MCGAAGLTLGSWRSGWGAPAQRVCTPGCQAQHPHALLRRAVQLGLVTASSKERQRKRLGLRVFLSVGGAEGPICILLPACEPHKGSTKDILNQLRLTVVSCCGWWRRAEGTFLVTAPVWALQECLISLLWFPGQHQLVAGSCEDQE